MSEDARLALRLIRGSGKKDYTRLALMAAGSALAVVALLIALAVPAAFTAASDRLAKRLPQYADQPGVGLGWTSIEQAVDGRIWTQITLVGGDATSPVPPGLDALPPVGRSVVSPALRQLAAQDPRLLATLTAIEPSNISDGGLTGPNELLSYTRVPGQTTGPVVSDFGVSSAPDTNDLGPVGLEAMILVGFPAVVFLSVCARLSVASRSRRLRALRLLGVSEDRCARIFAAEMAVIALVGTTAGILLYQISLPWIASGTLGFAWFPEDTSVTALGALLAIVVLPGATAIIARRSIRRALNPRDSTEPSGWTATLGFVLAVPAFAFLAWMMLKIHNTRPGEATLNSGVHIPYTLAAFLAVAVGLILLVPHATRLFADRLSTTAVPPGLRIGARMAATHYRTGARLVAALVATIMIAGVASAFVRALYLDGVGDPTTSVISLTLDGLSQAERKALATALPATATGSIPAAQSANPDIPAFVEVVPCAEFLASSGVASVGQCPDGPARVAIGDEYGSLVPGSTVSIPLAEGQPVNITVPNNSLGVNGTFQLLVPPSSATWLTQAREGVVTVTASKANDEDVELFNDLTQAAPSARVQIAPKDPAALARFQSQSAILGSCLAIAFLLCLAAFAVTIIESRWSNTRAIAAQRALGTPNSVISVSASAQMALPVTVAAVLAIPATWMVANLFLSFWGSEQAGSSNALTTTTVLAALAILGSAGLGWLSGRGRLNLEDLYTE